PGIVKTFTLSIACAMNIAPRHNRSNSMPMGAVDVSIMVASFRLNPTPEPVTRLESGKELAMSPKNPLSRLALGAAVGASLFIAAEVSAADKDEWPGTKAGAPTPKV